MKLGTETGSLINHLSARAVKGQPQPKVGMGATILCWTDRHAATVTSIVKVMKTVNKERVEITIVGVKRDKAKVVKGSTHDGSAEYDYSSDEKAREEFWGFVKERWTECARTISPKGKITHRFCKGNGLAIGYRDEHYDPSF